MVVRVSCELEDHMMEKGVEEDHCLLLGRNGWFPELFQGVKKLNGKMEFVKVGAWRHENVVMQVATEVGS